jgi:hypothetical protein
MEERRDILVTYLPELVALRLEDQQRASGDKLEIAEVEITRQWTGKWWSVTNRQQSRGGVKQKIKQKINT